MLTPIVDCSGIEPATKPSMYHDEFFPPAGTHLHIWQHFHLFLQLFLDTFICFNYSIPFQSSIPLGPIYQLVTDPTALALRRIQLQVFLKQWTINLNFFLKKPIGLPESAGL